MHAQAQNDDDESRTQRRDAQHGEVAFRSAGEFETASRGIGQLVIDVIPPQFFEKRSRLRGFLNP